MPNAEIVRPDFVQLVQALLVAKGAKPEHCDVMNLPGVQEDIAFRLIHYVNMLRNDLNVITVDYSMRPDEMISAAHFHYVDPQIVRMAPSITFNATGTKQEKLVLIDLSRRVQWQQAWKAVVNLGVQPAKFEHACAFGKKGLGATIFLGTSSRPEGRGRVLFVSPYFGGKYKLGYEEVGSFCEGTVFAGVLPSESVRPQ